MGAIYQESGQAFAINDHHIGAVAVGLWRADTMGEPHHILNGTTPLALESGANYSGTFSQTPDRVALYRTHITEGAIAIANILPDQEAVFDAACRVSNTNGSLLMGWGEDTEKIQNALVTIAENEPHVQEGVIVRTMDLLLANPEAVYLDPKLLKEDEPPFSSEGTVFEEIKVEKTPEQHAKEISERLNSLGIKDGESLGKILAVRPSLARHLQRIRNNRDHTITMGMMLEAEVRALEKNVDHDAVRKALAI